MSRPHLVAAKALEGEIDRLLGSVTRLRDLHAALMACANEPEAVPDVRVAHVPHPDTCLPDCGGGAHARPSDLPSGATFSVDPSPPRVAQLSLEGDVHDVAPAQVVPFLGTQIRDVLTYLQETGGATRAEIAKRFGMTMGHVDATLYRLRDRHLLAPKEGRGSPVRAAPPGTPVAVPKPKPRPVVVAREPTPDTQPAQILAFIRATAGGAVRRDIAAHLGIPIEQVDSLLYRMRKRGLLAPKENKRAPEQASTGQTEAGSTAVVEAAPPVQAKAPLPPKKKPEVVKQAPKKKPEAAKPVSKRLAVAMPPPAPKSVVHAPPATALPASQLVEVRAIAVRTDRFKCVPLACTLTAGSCIERQAKANGATEGINRAALDTRKQANAYSICRNCTLGQAVKKQIEAQAG